jgi:hypothetical protein
LHNWNFVLHYIHFELAGDPCNLIASQQCDLFTNCSIFCSKLHLFPSKWERNTKTKQPIGFQGLFKQGSHAPWKSLKVLEFQNQNSRPWKSVKRTLGPWKTLKFVFSLFPRSGRTKKVLDLNKSGSYPLNPSI